MADGEFIASIVSLLVFYLLIIIIGVVSTIWFRRKYKLDKDDFDMQIIAGRKLGPVVGFMSMSATLVGGGFLNGTAESVARDGVAWTLAPFGIFLGLVIGGVVYAPRMRRRSYRTMLEPMEEAYGGGVTALIYLSSLFGDILWSAAVLSALGTTIHVVIGLSRVVSVVVSAVVAVGYTLIGQMVSVAYTDIAEMAFMTLGLAVVTPFAMTHADIQPLLAKSLSATNSSSPIPWLGSVTPQMAGFWADLAVAMTLGSIPWQSYFQRVLSVNSASNSRLFSIAAGFAGLLFAVPPICLGVVGSVADWNTTGVAEDTYTDKSLTLPLVIKTFTPAAVSVLGLGTIAAAVMSSADSAILGSSSMFTNHIYVKCRLLVLHCRARYRPADGGGLSKPSGRELGIILKVAVILVGAVSAAVALLTPSLTIYGLFILAADVVFVAVLPQLTCALFLPFSNGYGGLLGYALSLFLRLAAGEPMLGLKEIIRYPYYDESMDLQLFPLRTFAMLCGLACSALVSYLSQRILRRLPAKWDVLNAVHKPVASDPSQSPDRHDGQSLTDRKELYQPYPVKRESLAFEEF